MLLLFSEKNENIQRKDKKRKKKKSQKLKAGGQYREKPHSCEVSEVSTFQQETMAVFLFSVYGYCKHKPARGQDPSKLISTVQSVMGTRKPFTAETAAPDKSTRRVFRPRNSCRLGTEPAELVVVRVLIVQRALELGQKKTRARRGAAKARHCAYAWDPGSPIYSEAKRAFREKLPIEKPQHVKRPGL